MGIKIASKSKKALRFTLSLTRLDDREIGTCFYGKRQKLGKRM